MYMLITLLLTSPCHADLGGRDTESEARRPQWLKGIKAVVAAGDIPALGVIQKN